MPKPKSGRYKTGIRTLRKTRKQERINKAVKQKIRSLIKDLKDAVDKKDLDTAKKLLQDTFSRLDKAAKRKIIHKNTAANKKSKLNKLVNSLTKK